MFDNTFFVAEVIEKIFSKGKIEDDEAIFQEFNKFLNGLGLDVALSTFHLKPWKEKGSNNDSDNGNSISVYIRTTDNFTFNGFTENGNWDEEYKQTELIKEKWKELAQQYNLPEAYYNHISYVWVYDFEKAYLYKLLDNSKAEFIKQINKTKRKVKPEYIFGSSVPAYNISL